MEYQLTRGSKSDQFCDWIYQQEKKKKNFEKAYWFVKQFYLSGSLSI